MAATEDALAYLYRHYPRPGELSIARLCFMMYLADWRSAILYGKTISSIIWHLGSYGPQISTGERREEWSSDEAKRIIREAMTHGKARNMDKPSRQILDHVIAAVEKRSWVALSQLVYSTFPIITQPRYKKMNLVGLAQRYIREYRPLFTGTS